VKLRHLHCGVGGGHRKRGRLTTASTSTGPLATAMSITTGFSSRHARASLAAGSSGALLVVL